MFGGRRRRTIIGDGLKVTGKVTAEALIDVYGRIDGEVSCNSLYVSRKAQINGAITATKVVVDGRVDGPIVASEVVLKARAHVVGDIHHQRLDISKGAYFEGRSVQARGANGSQPDKGVKKLSRPNRVVGLSETTS